MLADYYPLTPWSIGEDQWIAWQFHRPENGEGMVQAFRRPQCDVAGQVFRLRGLDRETPYRCIDLDGRPEKTLTGGELMDQGLPLEIEQQPGSILLRYAAVK